MVAKLLFLSKRGRQDIQTTITFLITRIYEENNLRNQISGSFINIVLRLSAKAPLMIKWCQWGMNQYFQTQQSRN
jgi:hypothetical protein